MAIEPPPMKTINAAAQKLPDDSVSSFDLATIDLMTIDELRGLVRRVSGAMWGYALQDKEQKKEALRLKIYGIAMNSSNDAVILKAANDWLDREEGKPMQRVQAQVAIATVSLEDRRKEAQESSRRHMEIVAARGIAKKDNSSIKPI